ncbi:MAG: HAD-IB family phosphatase [Candidatus Eremiobacteraeota bacterium]|nr:HAD-IB family phosphatase [Candidatus Eremiobacteraeota bacterium]
MPVEIFVDFDGTVTDVDTFDVLVRRAGGDELWTAIEDAFHRREITLREALEREAAFVKLDREAGFRAWDQATRIEPDFAEFVRTQRSRGATITIVSAGIATLIHRALARLGLSDLPVVANDVDFDPGGWRFRFRDDSPDGLYKERYVQAARERGARTAYLGDGISDYRAIHDADRRFAKRGRALERYLERLGLEFTPFSTFAEVSAVL